MAKLIKKPTISITGLPFDLAKALAPIKQCLEMIMGARGNGLDQLKGLSESASTADIVRKINEIVDRLNVTGTHVEE